MELSGVQVGVKDDASFKKIEGSHDTVPLPVTSRFTLLPKQILEGSEIEISLSKTSSVTCKVSEPQVSDTETVNVVVCSIVAIGLAEFGFSKSPAGSHS